MRARSLLLLLFAIAAVSSIAACWDPVRSDAVEALGPERKGVLPGPSHRPGQPCLTCHGGDGPGSPQFAAAGTIYSAEGIAEPIEGVNIVLVDSIGAKRSAVSNEVGNFYIATDEWMPVFPLRVELEDMRADEKGVKKMITSIGRSGDCATCHYGADHEPSHMPPVYLRLKAL